MANNESGQTEEPGVAGGSTFQQTYVQPSTIKLPRNSRTVKVTPPSVTPEQYEAAQKAVEAQRADITAGVDEVTQESGQMGALFDAWQKRAMDDLNSLGTAAAPLKQSYDTTYKALNDTFERIKNKDIDPDRYVQSMPTWKGVMLAIGSLGGGLAEGFSGGQIPNEIPKIIQRAIDRDLAKQELEYNKLLKLSGLQKDQALLARQAWKDHADEEKAKVMSLTQIKLAQMSLMSKKMDVRIQANKAIGDMEARLGKLREKMATRVTESRTSGYITAKVGDKAIAGNKPIDQLQGEELKSLTNLQNAPNVIGRIFDYTAEMNGAGFFRSGWKALLRNLPTEERAKYNNLLQDVSEKLKELSGTAISPGEYQRTKAGYDAGIASTSAALELGRGLYRRTKEKVMANADLYKKRGLESTAKIYDDMVVELDAKWNKFRQQMGDTTDEPPSPEAAAPQLDPALQGMGARRVR